MLASRESVVRMLVVRVVFVRKPVIGGGWHLSQLFVRMVAVRVAFVREPVVGCGSYYRVKTVVVRVVFVRKPVLGVAVVREAVVRMLGVRLALVRQPVVIKPTTGMPDMSESADGGTSVRLTAV